MRTSLSTPDFPSLSARLQAFLDEAVPGAPLWDLCCDHGLLGLAALGSERFPKVHFVDSSEAAMKLLEGRLAGNRRAGFHVKPAQEIDEDLTGSVVIAGVGGLLIWKILQTLQVRGALKARRLILGPHRDEAWLADQLRLGALPSWNLTKEARVLERGRSRHLLVAEKF